MTISKSKSIVLAISLALLVTGSVSADWSDTEPAKWVQLPDLSPLGIDVNATLPTVLADDFLCTSTGPITDIHIWGSWLRDILPVDEGGNGDAHNVWFELSIHKDIPAVIAPDGTVERHSMPGDLLWSRVFQPDEIRALRYAEVDPGEGWYDPNTGEYLWPADQTVWQYNFFIDEAEAYIQEGTRDNPIVYWLDVTARVPQTPTAPAQFGWKTSIDHWNDDAVWGDSHDGPWNELIYPSNHEFGGRSIDLAFVITPEPATVIVLAIGGIAALLRRNRR